MFAKLNEEIEKLENVSAGSDGAPTPEVTSGVNVLKTEARALVALAAALDDSFVNAISLMERPEGRVVCTGMGKSGHIARKMAATFASTGTPSLFVHPGEASHGDLGMVVGGDVVLALSNSGETPELGDIVEYTRRYSIPLISITSKPESTLGRRSDVALVLPKMKEACPNGQAPTTSTTMMLALGDALAVALLEKRGFTAQDFHTYHPGGKLGSQFVKVRDIMHGKDEVPLISEDALMSEALLVMTQQNLGCVGITDGSGKLKGIISDGDLKRHMSPDLLTRPAREVMTTSPRTIHENALAVEALAAMNLKTPKITGLFVLDDDDGLAGYVHIHDILLAGVA